ncbi:major capsid protein [Basilea psittacipulmonis]|uniref:Phage protein n=1 Tax=Basilea psittacipulmonis DSM 24701 TaxID=1072685 RepID=A0A077DE24_9BURK|nr:phage protein [Basilea psittacipulmonis]AIL33100.1 phage protein [Basilea psittacipulmonis DSM 24701]
MAVLSTQNPTLADVAKRLDPGGSIDQIVELLNETNPILQDMTFVEGNLPTGHKTTVRTGLPAPTWRKLYGGVQPARSTTVQITDSTGMLEAYAEVDKALADLNGNTAAFRLSEDRAFIEGMNQEMASTIFYGNESSEPAAFTGFAPRIDSKSAGNADNIIDAGGTGNNNSSIYLVVWGPNTVHGIYPKGSKAGLSVKDLGEVTVENADGKGGRMQAYRTHYRWDAGLCVRDWRYLVRIANIDMQALKAANGVESAKKLINYLIQATERIPQLNLGRPAIYLNRELRTHLRLGIQERIASNLTWETVAGKPVLTFDGIPVHACDAVLSTEARVV